jgi:chemotaxis protein MotB
MANEPPIIVIKKKGGHGGHHGGAWKVAYADFVTAMMALFIVLWLMSSTNKQTQEEIAGYFRDPSGTNTRKGVGAEQKGNSPLKREDLSKLREALLQQSHRVDDLKNLKGQIEVTITDEGLRIELIEDKKGTFFETGSAQPTPLLVEILKLLSVQLGKLPNNISVEGHTDAQPYAKETSYGNWELSADRANVARRLMQTNGVRSDQISQVRGFAAQRLRKPLEPLDASNRRISLIVGYLDDADRQASSGARPQPGGKLQGIAASAPKQEARGTKSAPAQVAKAAVETALVTHAKPQPGKE